MTSRPRVNNAFYDTLGERWYEDDGHAIALLRCESESKLQFIDEAFAACSVPRGARILDVGCGAGLLGNPLAARGYRVRGLDLSEGSLEVARRHADAGADVTYAAGDALNLPEADGSYDAVLLMDVLEHVDRPDLAIAQAFRVLTPGGVLVFYTFNRTWLAGLLAVKALEWFSQDYPAHLHVLAQFIRPAELTAMIESRGARVHEIRGLRPTFGRAFWASLARRRLDPDFRFAFTPSLAVGYLGYAVLAA